MMSTGSAQRGVGGRAVVAAVVWSLAVGATAVASEGDASAGIWPTPRMIDLFAQRILEEHALRYGFDQKQRDRFQKRLSSFIPAFLEKHRTEIEPLVNDVILQHLSGKIPTTQKVTGWGRTALPILQEAMDAWDGAYREMRPHLRPEQRTRWGRDHFKFKLGYALAEGKLRSYAQGKFQAREWHQMLPGPYQEEREVMAAAKREGLDTDLPPDLASPVITQMDHGALTHPPTGPPRLGQSAARQHGPSRQQALPLDKWEGYTKQFIRRYELDEGQSTSAMAILEEMRARAVAYRDRRGPEIARLQAQLRQARGEARSRLRAALQELERPIGTMFDEFRDRLDGLLRESQRELTRPGG